MKKLYYLNHSKIDAYFKQSKEDFVVDEIPLYEFTGEGEHIVLKVRKKILPLGICLRLSQLIQDVR